MWELSDPKISTRKKGSALDKFLLLPGTNIPDEWLPSQSRYWVEAAEMLSEEDKEAVLTPPFYPAQTFGFSVIADHHPVMLQMAGRSEACQRENKAFELKNITAEE